MTVQQLESRWRNLYQKGYNAFDRHDYPEAELCFREGVNLLASNDAANSTYHIYSLIKLGETYFATFQRDKQKAINDEILSVRQMIRPGSKRFVEYLYSLGLYYSNTGRFKDAIGCLNEALTYDKVLSEIPGSRARILNRLALCRFCGGDIPGAVAVSRDVLSCDVNKTPDYIKALAYYYFKSSDWAELEALIPRCYEDCREPILRQFSRSKALDRASYWSKEGLFFTDYIPYFAYTHPSDVLVSYAYDAALLSKGVLLAAENKTSELTLTSNDPELIKLYEHYLELKGKKNRTVDEDFEMDALSDVILRNQKEHKNEYRKDFRIGWRDVSEKLKEGDIAIEFITVPSESGFDDYAALWVKKGMTAPRLTKLCDFGHLSSVPSSRIYTSSDLYELVWGPLEGALEGVKNVYFSPAGMFYSTGIEYLPNEFDMAFNTTRNTYRLSSTKEIVLSQSRKIKSGALFGGINYDMGISSMVGKPLEKDADDITPIQQSAPVDSLNLRGTSGSSGFAYLEGTMEEVGDISMVFLESDIPAYLYSGDDGSETAFKAMTGRDVGIVHIATHGFYYANKGEGRRISLDKLFRELNLHFSSDDVQTLNEDKMLTRSGLIFAGANNVLRRIPIPEGIDDGILHADEISALNLSEVELLVLSACQSGLGDIASSEGVFGLQRGFKLAGVHSIVMSLWKVDDNATRILMTEMYKNMAAGQNKREALVNAQIALRSVEDGRYDKPEYWAAFILLDALD